jgi:hypothetical protein
MYKVAEHDHDPNPFIIPLKGLTESFPASIVHAFAAWRTAVSLRTIRVDDASNIDVYIHDAISYWKRVVEKQVSAVIVLLNVYIYAYVYVLTL